MKVKPFWVIMGFIVSIIGIGMFGFVGIFFIGVSWETYQLTQALSKRGIQSAGVIIDCETVAMVSSTHYEYTAVNPTTGREQTYQHEESRWPGGCRPRQEIEVLYLPEDPQQAQAQGLNTRRAEGYAVLSLIGWIYTGIGIMAFRNNWRAARHRVRWDRWLRQFPFLYKRYVVKQGDPQSLHKLLARDYEDDPELYAHIKKIQEIMLLWEDDIIYIPRYRWLWKKSDQSKDEPPPSEEA